MRFGLMSIRLAALTAILAPLTTLAASSVDDDFVDGVRGTQWSTVVDDPAHLSLAEQNGHLNLLSTGGGVPTNDAIYLSTFKVSTAANFSIQLSYTLANPTPGGANGDRLGLVFGVGRDLPDGTDSAAIGVGYGKELNFVATAATAAYRVKDVQTALTPNEAFPANTGTLEVDYIFATDTLSMTRVGSGITYTLPAGTVRGTAANQWGTTDGLYVSFGGRGSGMVSTAGQLSVDNFTVVTGNVIPEPACLTALAGVSLLLRRRRR